MRYLPIKMNPVVEGIGSTETSLNISWTPLTTPAQTGNSQIL